MNTLLEAPAGLKGLIVAETSIGEVRGAEGFYHYRGRSALELATEASFEQVWGLLVEADPRSDLSGERRLLEPAVASQIGSVAVLSADLGAAVRAGVAVLGAARGYRATTLAGAAERQRNAIEIAAALPTIVATVWAAREGLAEPVPDPTLGHAADYLRMITGAVPTQEAAGALEAYLIATLDHGFNASTFTARVVTSTGADVASAVVSGLAALSGPLHGGAPSFVLDMLDEIGDPANAAAWTSAALEAGDKIMGFGHAVYEEVDPRSALLEGIAAQFGGPRVEQAAAVETVVLSSLRAAKPSATIATNVEYWAAVVLEACGVPRPLFTSTFAVSRVVGWTAHILEQAANNKIMRPSSRYVGPIPT
jgi:citrate synthase